MTVLFVRKIGMSQIFNENDSYVPVTLVRVLKNSICAVKTIKKDGYSAVQIGAQTKKIDKKSIIENLKKKGISERLSKFTEYRTEEIGLKVGDEIEIETLNINDKVSIIGKSKGKGFSGTVKRHNFTIGPKSHGSNNQRQPGSIGSAYPQRVVKGRKMPGRMGANRITVKNLEIVDIDKENRILAIKGAIPGPNRSISVLEKI